MSKKQITLKRIQNWASNNLKFILFIMLILSLLNLLAESQKEACTKQSLEHISSISYLQLKAMDAHVSRIGYSMNKIDDHMCVLENLTSDNFEACLNNFKNKETYYYNKTNNTTNEYIRYLSDRDRRFDAYNETQGSYVIWDGLSQLATIILVIINIIMIVIEMHRK